MIKKFLSEIEKWGEQVNKLGLDTYNVLEYKGLIEPSSQWFSDAISQNQSKKVVFNLFNNASYNLNVNKLKNLAESFILNGLEIRYQKGKARFGEDKRKNSTSLTTRFFNSQSGKDFSLYLSRLFGLVKNSSFVKELNGVNCSKTDGVEIKFLQTDRYSLIVLRNKTEIKKSIGIDLETGIDLIELYLEKGGFEYCGIEKQFLAQLFPLQTKIFMLTKPSVKEEKTYFSLTDKDWKVKYSTPNCLLADRFLPIIDGVLYPEMDSLALNELVKEIRPKTLKMIFNFSSEIDFDSALISVESKGVKGVNFNGEKLAENPVNTADSAIYHYNCKIKEGENCLEIDYQFDEKDSAFAVESAYITGDFAVKTSPRTVSKGCVKFKEIQGITRLSNTIKPSTITSQGRPFFAGEIILEKEVNVQSIPKNAYLSISVNNLVACVKINEKLVGGYAWLGQEYNVAPLLKEGKNVVEISLLCGERNVLGPFHNRLGDVELVNEEAFAFEDLKSQNDNFSELYFVKDCGIKF